MYGTRADSHDGLLAVRLANFAREQERTRTCNAHGALPKPTIGARGISGGDPAQKLAETRGVFEECGGCTRRERETFAKRSAPGVAIFVIYLRQGRGRRVRAIVEKCEKHGKSMKSIRSHEGSKCGRGEKEIK